ncbi:PepSY domain-containing protein [Pyruvatibacter mobilis]|uniref:PepSY domain-containing protein n=1 Tax=Pyruvatibacter mobilis TaxID=1712261 RepID=UPI003BAD7AB1|tara:strand:- start:86 stop:364 length:279 start_codon:yes stop_codon:yes gene_type:complete
MKRTLLATALALGIMGAGTAIASNDDRCNVPMADWQPVEALQQKLEADGWKVNRIKTDDGCYEVYAIDDKGRRIEAYFNPKSFDMVKMEIED